MSRIMKVIIYDAAIIPGLGQGPFLEPVAITDEKFFLYKRMGLKVVDVTNKAPIAESGIRNRQFNEKPSQAFIESERQKKTEVKKTVEKEVYETPVIKEEVPEEVETPVVEDETTEDFDEIFNSISEETETPAEVEAEETEEDEVESDSEEEDIESDEEVNLEELTKKELQGIIAEYGLEYDSKWNKATLIKFIEENCQ